jgi:LDH2 family malate/lactate/ureidoglycolate dehydrogenase
MPIFTGEKINSIAFHVLCAAGTPDEYSRIIADHISDTSLTGHDSHGFIRVIQYVKQIREGIIVPDAKPEIVSESPTTAQVEGHRGFGHVVATFTTEIAIRKAKELGVGAVTMRNLSHLGRLGAYAEMAAAEGLAVWFYCGSGGTAPLQAPFGGRERRLCTNPMAMAFPAEGDGPILADFATSVAAEGKIRVYRARGEKLPNDWILDKEGRASNDPNDFYDGGCVLPIGGTVGHKGFALAFMTDILSGILSRGGFAGNPTTQFSNATLILALDIERFVPLADAAAEAAKAAEFVVNTPLAEGSDGIMYPGQKETKNRKERGKTGVDIEQETWQQILDLIHEFKLEEKLSPLPE